MLNAFDRQMCEEVRERLAAGEGRPRGPRRRAAGRGRPGVLRRPRHQEEPYGQPDDVWNHEDPGELLSPKWQKVWKPVVCAVQGICTAGAFYFVNEADIVICSPDATFFDSHVTYGHGVGARAGRPDAPGRPGPDAAHGAHRATTSG